MLKFAPGSFGDISNTPTAVGLWKLLNEPNSLIRMQTASYLKRPALEPMQPFLLAEFGDEIRADRWKQMIGRMTRQIMEHQGYALDQPGVRIRGGELFTSAARYKKSRA